MSDLGSLAATASPDDIANPAGQGSNAEYSASYGRLRTRVQCLRVFMLGFLASIAPLTSLVRDLLGRVNGVIVLLFLAVAMGGIVAYVHAIWKCPRCGKSLRKDMKDKLCRGCGERFH